MVQMGWARAGSRTKAVGSLREGLDIAYRQGGLRLVGHARRELVIAGSKPRRDAIRGRDALTASELRVAELVIVRTDNHTLS
jgi:hypothetical protein